jgi:hypothetical protein
MATFFGYSNCISGHIIVVGAFGDSSLTGSAYVYFKDTDGDGIPDDEDSCPFEDATGFDVDGNGCIDSIGGLTT